jgi:hypothetical protein
MAFKGQAPGHGHSPSGNFGHGGHFKKDNIHATPSKTDPAKADNMHTVTTNTAGNV